MKPFSNEYYRFLLGELLKTHRPVTYDRLDEGRNGNCFLLRHDIDYGLEFLGDIPEIEHEMGCQATYFIQTGTDMYNIFGPVQQKQLARLKSLGHRFGLHTCCCENTGKEQLETFIDWEYALLRRTLPVLDAVSFHVPPSYICSNEIRLKKYINTYDRIDMQGYEYMSDSCRKWSKGDPVEYLHAHPERSYQILVHPFLWENGEQTFVDTVALDIRTKVCGLYDYLAAYNQDIAKYDRVKFFEESAKKILWRRDK